MTRKHFEAIAALLAEVRKDYPAQGAIIPDAVSSRLADYFEKENPRFDRAKFLTACGF